MSGNLRKQAAPGNVSTRVGVCRQTRVDEQALNGTLDKTGRAVVSGSRMFNTVFGLPRNVENIARSFGTFESGSPPGQATIDRRWMEEPVFQSGSRRAAAKQLPDRRPILAATKTSLFMGLEHYRALFIERRAPATPRRFPERD